MSAQTVKTTKKAKAAAEDLGSKIEKLDQAVDWFYSDDFSLAEAVDHYKKASELAESIEDDLRALKNKIEVVEQDFSEDF